MTRMIAGRTATALLVVAIGGCAGSTRAPAAAVVQPKLSPAAGATSGSRPYTAADVQFMSGMIVHHAQAVLIAGWAPSHGASPALRTMAERIVVGQRDETTLMTRWLRDRGETVPGADSSHPMMPGMDHSMLMPGMLTAEQLAQLDHARGGEFDRLFLTFMTAHHQGALTMVNQLFGAQGAAQEETVFRMGSDIYADQSTEIDRMQKMLVALPPQESRP